MRNSLLLYLCVMLYLISSTALAMAEKRVALVIGNEVYQHTSRLKNPVNDAQKIARSLQNLGFDVIYEHDLNADQFSEVLMRFGTKLSGADVSLFYYAGHGLQYRGENYLVPVDARLRNEFSLKRETFLASDIIEQMESLSKVNLVFLDACRNNPLSDSLRRSMSSTRAFSIGQGLGPLPRLSGETLLVYAAAPGAVALDGKGQNSPFASALLKHMATPGLEVEVMLKRVTRFVRKVTGEAQRPERLSQLTSEFYFRKRPKVNLEKQKRQSAKQDYLTKRVAALEERIRQGKKKQSKRFIPKLVAVPGGTFSMGCMSGKECQDDETPVHQVSISPFFIGKYEITFNQWDACVSGGGCKHKASDKGWGRGNRPVIDVSWQDATAYANWLSTKTGQIWRLPTEAEWEYVARAGTKTRYAFGDTIGAELANYGYQIRKTLPVGQYPANGFGVHDMHGNVWEWVSDFYDAKYYGQSPKKDPKGSKKGASKVFRGGSWLFEARNLRSSDRNSYAPNFRSNNLGFRLVREK